MSEQEETTRWIKNQTTIQPETGIILGSGLGNFADKIDIELAIPYEDIPHFPVSTVEGHSGNLIFGKVNGKEIVAMQGRFHFYEGYDLKKATFPIKIMKKLGVKNLLVSNASGGTNPDYKIGDLVIIKDHIHYFPDNPLRGKNDSSLGPRFPDMSNAYSKRLIELAERKAAEMNIKVQKGVYMAWQGPTYETPAEYKFVHILGADVVGMSTTPEVIAAKHLGIECFGVSIVTDLGVEGKIVEISHEEVTKASNKAAPLLTQLFSGMITEL